MTSEDLRQRTMRFGVRIIGFVRLLQSKTEIQVIRKQLMRSATSVAANYRAAGRARSRAEFFAKLSIVVEEADEALFWLEMIHEARLDHSSELSDLLKEAKELVHIFSASRRTARENLKHGPQ